ncbi:MAG TPA: serine/threonine-protein kinase [Jatrophihabitantaceae bacterium]|nr:serine/threonine-protein kinase [Jatrophihabitantaceae bacterium]
MTAPTSKVPGYVRERLIGRGSSGDVWRARSTSTGELVALKFVTVGDEVQLAAAQSEAAVLIALDHPHLVRIHEVVPIDDALVLVLDLAEGGSLAGLLEARGRLTPGEVITAICPIAAAVAYAHANGVVHGDVTPSNILFTEAGLPLLADLGVARLHGREADVRSTPAYIDPAVAAGSVPGPPSDVFMLAAVAFHALTGRSVWPGDTADEVLASARAGRTVRLGHAMRTAHVDEVLAAVVRRGLTIEPGGRGTAAEFALDLRAAGEPAPVELRAGRARADLPPVAPASDVAAEDSGAVFTRAVSRARPVLHRRTKRRLRRPGLPSAIRRHRRAWLFGALAVLVVGAGTGIAVATIGGSSSDHRSAASTTPFSIPPIPVTSTTPGSSETALQTVNPTTTAPRTPLVDSTAADVLKDLDALRERAFARRAPVLLTGVYPAGTLLDQDVALLQRLVPTGCGLEHVRTTYSKVQVVTFQQNTTIVTADATLSESILVCGGVASGRAPGSGPTHLTITLTWRGNGYLISAIQR